MKTQVRDITEADREVWLEMRRLLWPSYEVSQLESEIEEFLAQREQWGLFLAINDGKPAGFAECQLRDSAAGCESSNVGYLEGWYVRPEARRSGVGRALANQCEDWARERGATEMASDTTTEYTESPAAHAALGFVEVKRRFLYRKDL